MASAHQGAPRRAHLEAAAKRGVARAIAALEGPPLPEPLAHVWEWFLELDAARGVSALGPDRLTYADIHAWAVLTGRVPRPEDVRLLFELDRVRRDPDAKEAS